MNYYYRIIFVVFVFLNFGKVYSQQDPAAVNCGGAVAGCNLPSFYISTDNSQNITDFGIGTGSNPIYNPNNPNPPGNQGCLISGETTSTFITINVMSSGQLEWSIESPQTACLDWIMWPNTPTVCGDLQAGTQAPVACNWNGSCGGFTGMAAPGNLPTGAASDDFEYALNVLAGESYLLCLSNYSQISAPMDLSFFGSASVSCDPSTPDQTICNGSSATVDIIAPSTFINPTFNWLVTTAVSNPNSGVGVIVSPTVTTEYQVEIHDGATAAMAIDTFLITVEDPPTPYAGVDQTVCLGDPISLSGTPTDPVNNTIVWLPNTSMVTPSPSVSFAPNSQSLTPTVTVNQTGTYLFILREGNTVCGNHYDTLEVVVSELNITASSVSPSCMGYSDGEIHIDSPDAVEYSFDGGTTWQVDSFAVIFGAGQYSVCGRSALGCEKCTQVDVVDPAPVVISVSNDTTVCENGTANLLASATGGNSYFYHWDFTSSTNATQNVSPTSHTVYSVYAENENGCISTTESIDVSLYPPLSGSISALDTICPGYPTDVWADVSGGIGTPYNFVWSSGETQSGPNTTHQFSVNPPVTKDYTVTITDGCETTPLVMMTNVYVAPLPVPQYEVLDPEQCEPAVFHVVNRTDSALSQYSYWLVEGVHEYVNMDTIVTPELYEGAYDIQMIITSYLGCIDSTTFEAALEVKPKPVASFQHSPNPVKMFNTQVIFTSTSTLANEYEWYFESGYPSLSNESTAIIQFPDGKTGTYFVSLVVTSELGCKDTADYELIILPEVVIYAPNAFTPDGDEFNQGWRVYMEGVDVYDFELLVFNRWGQIVWESHDIEVPWDGTFDGVKLPAGTYTWTIETKDQVNDGKYTYHGHVNIIK